MSFSKLFLVDHDGSPLADHIVDAVEHIAPLLTSRYSGCCDSAELDNCLEDGARSVAAHERKTGPIEDLLGFTSRVLSNRAISVLRRHSKEIPSPTQKVLALAGEAREGNPQSLYSAAYVREQLEKMAIRDRHICALEYQGFTAKEIATALGMTCAAVWQAQSRRRSRLHRESVAGRP
jgi:DNA-directed RNA polymerase specialized sigma24 family protein